MEMETTEQGEGLWYSNNNNLNIKNLPLSKQWNKTMHCQLYYPKDLDHTKGASPTKMTYYKDYSMSFMHEEQRYMDVHMPLEI